MEWTEKLEQRLRNYRDMGVRIPTRRMIKTKEQIEGIRRAGEANTSILNLVDDFMRSGISTEDINRLVHDATVRIGGIPSAGCILKDGDIINVDVTTILGGYYADASRMYRIGQVSKEADKLIRVTKECLVKSISEVKPWSHLGNIGAVISEHAYANGFTVVRDICGHGVGIQFHEKPLVRHIGVRGTGMLLVPGMVFTIEPMINAGGEDVCTDADDGWTIYTDDSSLSAQWEATILVTETGAEILTD